MLRKLDDCNKPSARIISLASLALTLNDLNELLLPITLRCAFFYKFQPQLNGGFFLFFSFSVSLADKLVPNLHLKFICIKSNVSINK